MIDFNDIEWHDGRLIACNLIGGAGGAKGSRLELLVSVYENHTAPNRVELILTFMDVDRVLLSCDVKELADNYGVGNINDAYRKGSDLYRVYLVDGLIELESKKVDISKQD